MSNETKIKKLIKDLNKRFPDLWVKPGVDFNGNEKYILWSGEGSQVEDVAAFSDWSRSQTYQFGVHYKLVEWANQNGLFWEMYDGGTWIAFSADFK